jgi:hypothetical protein
MKKEKYCDKVIPYASVIRTNIGMMSMETGTDYQKRCNHQNVGTT